MNQFTKQAALGPLLRKLERWAPVNQADQAAIIALPHKIKSIAAHEYIMREGDTSAHVCVILSGFAISHKVAGTGGRQITALHMQGDVIDLQNIVLSLVNHSVQALSAAQVAYIPVNEIEKSVLHRPALRAAMWRETMVDASIAREWILNVSRRNARMRTAHLLCEIGLRLEAAALGNQSSYRLPLTQEQLADILALTAVHVNRVLMAMRLEGLITIAHKTVIVQNWLKLTAIGDFDSAYLHMDGSLPKDPVFKAA